MSGWRCFPWSKKKPGLDRAGCNVSPAWGTGLGEGLETSQGVLTSLTTPLRESSGMVQICRKKSRFGSGRVLLERDDGAGRARRQRLLLRSERRITKLLSRCLSWFGVFEEAIGGGRRVGHSSACSFILGLLCLGACPACLPETKVAGEWAGKGHSLLAKCLVSYIILTYGRGQRGN